ncbi:RsmB/NOP family class I SAM-dependent RNA methyltransferase [Rhodobacter lacus]|uniref:RsmB/NOP family class I SAM-dependent RNA methyltransferase n=1 Tax=Rhodobacter lacus TaxID=1641972 RepID=A0ABW5AB36_9RHOB
MTPAARLQATLDLYAELARSERTADAVLSAWLRGKRRLDEPTRGAILDRLHALLRHHARLGWWIDRHGRRDTPRTRIIAWLVLGEGLKPEQIRRLFTGAPLAPAPLSEAEHGLMLKLQGAAMDSAAMPEEVRLECPPWALAPLRARFGAEFAAEMAALLAPPPLDLRVNALKAERAAMLTEFQGLGLPAHPLTRTAHGLRLAERLSLARVPGLKTGALEIQDEGSQLVARLVEAQPGERVVDFCAGAGGKTLAIAAQMGNKGRLIACDVSEGRLKRCAERARRAGLQNAEMRLLSGETDRWVKRHKGSFDRVLVDAPCSGTGTWRRNPDARWRAPEEQGLESLVALQARILASAARLVKPGGRLVYATCALLGEENEAQVAAFLAAHPAFSVVPLSVAAPELTDSAHPEYLMLTPARHGTDGFFAAVLTRADLPAAGA